MDDLLERQAARAGLSRRPVRGAGRVVLLRGEAGVGKTALIGGVSQQAREVAAVCCRRIDRH